MPQVKLIKLSVACGALLGASIACPTASALSPSPTPCPVTTPLVFDQDGNYLVALSSTTNYFMIRQPIQATNCLSLGANYQIAITKTKQTDPKAGPIPKTHQLAIYTNLAGASNLVGKYFTPDPPAVPNIYGHAAADSAIAVAGTTLTGNPHRRITRSSKTLPLPDR
jgi:hypothetical protein